MSLVGMFPPLFGVVDLGTINGMMATSVELIMLNRVRKEPGVEQAMQIIRADLRRPILRPRGSWCC